MRESSAKSSPVLVRLGVAAALLGSATVLPPTPASAQQGQAAPGTSAQDLKAAIAEIKRRVEQQRQAAGAAGAPPASAAAEDLRGTRDRIEGLARTMGELRAERDGLRGQLLQARDDLARAQQRLAAVEGERKGAVAEASGRAAALERELAAATARAEGLAKAGTETAAAGEAARKALAEREALQAAAEREAERLRREAAAGAEATRTLVAEAERLRGRTGELEGELARARAEAESGRAEAERRLAAEVDALKGRLAASEREAAELRTVASASVEEVRSVSEQLIMALAEKEKLVAASVALSSSSALRELQLAAREEEDETGGGGGLAAVAPGAGPAEPGTVRLAALTAPAPAPAVSAWSKSVIEGSLFAVGGDRLSPDAAAPLASVARQIREAKGGGIRVVGHTDANGEPDKNRRLSLRRAQAVCDYLVATYGFDPARFAVDGQGEAQPVASNDTNGGRRANRRVEVFVAR